VSDSDRAIAAYRLGHQSFMGVELLAAPGALVPRLETELLGRAALQALSRSGSGSRHLIDMCCGSGNLACALAAASPGARVWASDVADGCVSLARRNAEHLHLEDRITVVQGDLFAPLAHLPEGSVEVVVCNPPYISTGRLARDLGDLLTHEPRQAFDGGPYGLSIHQRVVREALPFLRPGGWLMFEVGAGQARQVALLFERAQAYEGVALVDDAGGQPRVAMGRKKAH
jgi:release factor glutamine methyltransferase